MDNSVQTILTKTTQFFKSKNFESPRLEAELLLSTAFKWERIQLYLKFDQPLSTQEIDKAREWVKRRAQGEPLAYITGEKFFYKNPFQVNPNVLIPRPESEIAVEWSVEKLKDISSPRLIDIGTGSGCLGLSILSELPSAAATLIDKSEGATQTAGLNAESLRLKDRTDLVCSDFIEFSKSQNDIHDTFDLIIANPPYLIRGDERVEASVRDFEPDSALYAEEEGFSCVREWSQQALPFLKSGGWMIFELGLDQDEKAVQHFKAIGLNEVDVVHDLRQVPRFIRGRR